MNKIDQVLNHMEEHGVGSEEISPDFVEQYAREELGIDLTSEQIAEISDIYGDYVEVPFENHSFDLDFELDTEGDGDAD